MEYQRFVAYVYEYRKGKKENNCGFLRVENRNQNVSVEIHLKCIGLPQNEKCNIYGFKRTAETMEGILLGSACSEREKLDCVIESQNDKNVSWQKEFTEFGGIVILTEHGAFFGTEWDDQIIKPQNFKEREETYLKNVQEDQEQEMNALEQDVETPEQLQNTLEQDANVPAKKINCEKQDTEASKTGANDVEIEAYTVEEADTKKKETAFCPFYDDEISECQLVKPNEFFKSCPPACALRNNRFLNHGISNFGHLLMGKRADGKQILGVPGRFDQQEQFMANMFGFPFFKESSNIQVQGGHGGYWYRLINPANFH